MIEEKEDISKMSDREKVLYYLDIVDEYEAMIESFKMWENAYDNVENAFDEYKKELDARTAEAEAKIPEERRNNLTDRQKEMDEKYQKRKEKVDKLLSKAAELYAKAMKTMTILVDNIQKLMAFLNKLMDINAYIQKITEFCTMLLERAANDPYVLQLKRRVDILVLKIKRIMVKVKKWLNKVQIRLLALFLNGKMCAAMEAVYGGIIIAISAVAKVIALILRALQTIINFLPSLFLIGPEGIAFFVTPKTLTGATNMPIMNMHKSIGDYMVDTVQQAIEAFLNAPKIANFTSKSAYVSKRVAEAQISMQAKAPDLMLPDLQVPDPELLIYKTIDLMLALMPLPQPLPKYEKLNMFTNLGYAFWLITGWTRAGQVAFGLPGQLPGIPAQYPETTET